MPLDFKPSFARWRKPLWRQGSSLPKRGEEGTPPALRGQRLTSFARVMTTIPHGDPRDKMRFAVCATHLTARGKDGTALARRLKPKRHQAGDRAGAKKGTRLNSETVRHQHWKGNIAMHATDACLLSAPTQRTAGHPNPKPVLHKLVIEFEPQPEFAVPVAQIQALPTRSITRGYLWYCRPGRLPSGVEPGGPRPGPRQFERRQRRLRQNYIGDNL